jgi:hypothetical protein
VLQERALELELEELGPDHAVVKVVRVLRLRAEVAVRAGRKRMRVVVEPVRLRRRQLLPREWVGNLQLLVGRRRAARVRLQLVAAVAAAARVVTLVAE